MSDYVAVGGPCRRQCDVDKETLVCRSCGLNYKQDDEKTDVLNGTGDDE